MKVATGATVVFGFPYTRTAQMILRTINAESATDTLLPINLGTKPWPVYPFVWKDHVYCVERNGGQHLIVWQVLTSDSLVPRIIADIDGTNVHLRERMFVYQVGIVHNEHIGCDLDDPRILVPDNHDRICFVYVQKQSIRLIWIHLSNMTITVDHLGGNTLYPYACNSPFSDCDNEPLYYDCARDQHYLIISKRVATDADLSCSVTRYSDHISIIHLAWSGERVRRLKTRNWSRLYVAPNTVSVHDGTAIIGLRDIDVLLRADLDTGTVSLIDTDMPEDNRLTCTASISSTVVQYAVVDESMGDMTLKTVDLSNNARYEVRVDSPKTLRYCFGMVITPE